MQSGFSRKTRKTGRSHTMRSSIITTIALCGLTACAPAPERVKATPVAAGAFTGLSCAALGQRRKVVDERVAGLSKAQRATRNGDIAGVLLLGLPLGRMSGGNVADELGKAKGEQQALTSRMAARGC
jgi:hypothetical protein